MAGYQYLTADDQAEVENLDPAVLDVVIDARRAHTPVVTKEGWVDCSCGWESNHPRLPSPAQLEAAKAIEDFDAVEVPAAPFLPTLPVGVVPTQREQDEVHAYNDWAREWTTRVRPPEPGDNEGAPDRTNDDEWRVHLGSVGRKAAIEKHVADGGTLADVPVEVATLGEAAAVLELDNAAAEVVR